MDEKSIPLTAFLAPKGIAAWTVMPFGLKNAPPVYMRIVDQAMSGLVRTGHLWMIQQEGHVIRQESLMIYAVFWNA